MIAVFFVLVIAIITFVAALIDKIKKSAGKRNSDILERGVLKSEFVFKGKVL